MFFKKEEWAVHIEPRGGRASPTIDERGDGDLLRTTSIRDKNTVTSTGTWGTDGATVKGKEYWHLIEMSQSYSYFIDIAYVFFKFFV